jgi:UPF0755 protein
MFRKIAWISVGLLVLLAGLYLYPKYSLYAKSRLLSANTEVKDFYIKLPTQLDELADQLLLTGIIDDKEAFMKVGNYKEMNELNIATGKYQIQPKTEYRNLLNGFKLNAAGNGNAEVEVEVTFNNCRDLNQLAGKVSQSIYVDSAELIQFLTNKKTLGKYGFTVQQFPAMFLPNTYRMFYDTDEAEFTERMAAEFRAFWNEERMAKLKAIGLKSPSQGVTLASIVYSEQSRHADEWPIIAGLYLNRIKKGIKLQSDPTFKFCWGDDLKGVQRLLNIHREIDCAYNTYKIQGLPPGPICIPPAQVVDAVLNRSEVNYIFMCAKPDYSGRHNFAVSDRDHVNNAKAFQTWLAAELKKKNNAK